MKNFIKYINPFNYKRLGKERFLSIYSIYFLAIFILVMGIIALEEFFQFAIEGYGAFNIIFVIFFLILVFSCFIAAVNMYIKRMRDLNYSGWWVLTYFIPVINIVTYIIMIFKTGTKGKNKYGEEPSPPSKKEKILYKIMVVVTIIAFVAGLLIELFI